MATKSGKSGPRKNKARERPWRRIALAIPISVILHLVVVIVLRPEYRPVADYAVDMDVLEVSPERPAPAKQEEPVAEPEKKPEPETQVPAEPKPSKEPAIVEKPKPTAVAMYRDGEGIKDAGISDAGLQPAPEKGLLAASEGLDGGVPGGGICMHDLFSFSKVDPSWLLWVSIKSFRQTALQKSIGRTLLTYTLGREISQATGIIPERDAEGLLVSTDNIFNSSSYRVIASYDSGEEKVRRKLTETQGKQPGFNWSKTEQGWEARQRDGYNWHLVGSGRVLAVTHEKSTPLTGTDAGPAGADQKNTGPGLFASWPRQVQCISSKNLEAELTRPGRSRSTNKKNNLVRLARSFLAPDKGGHWPVALFATRDPRAVGLGRHQKGRAVKFLFARARVYFSDPIRLEGEVHFSGPEKKIVALADQWQKIANITSADPFLAMAGLGNIFDKLLFKPTKNKIEFTLELNESKVRGALIFLQLQGEVLERYLTE